MMIPGELFTITNYQTIFMLGWQNTYTVLIVPFLVSVFYIYLLRQNFLQIPNELYLAAKVDGTGDFKYLWKVMVPLSLPTLISITILKMMGAWNSYVWPRLVANDDAHKLITPSTAPPVKRIIPCRWRRSRWYRSRCSLCSSSCASTSCPVSAAAVSKVNRRISAFNNFLSPSTRKEGKTHEEVPLSSHGADHADGLHCLLRFC